jgi:hypothetical protein
MTSYNIFLLNNASDIIIPFLAGGKPVSFSLTKFVDRFIENTTPPLFYGNNDAQLNRLGIGIFVKSIISATND